MDLAEIQKAVEEQGTAWKEFRETNDKRLVLLEGGKGTAELEEKLGKLTLVLDEKEAVLLKAGKEAEEKIAAELKSQTDRIETLEVALKRPRTDEHEGKELTPDEIEYKEKLFTYYRTGIRDRVSELELKTLNVSSDPDGGYTVTPQMSATIIEKAYETSPIRGLANIETISTDALEMLRETTEVSSGGWVGEMGTRAVTGTPQLGKLRIEVHEEYAMPRATQQMLDDSAINIEAWLNTKIAQKLGRTEATAFVTGNGVGKPKGILSYTTGTDPDLGQIQQVVSGDANLIQANGLIQLQDALFEDFQPNATFVMARATKTLIRLLVDSGTPGQYLLQPGLASGAPDSILGKPVVLAADMPAVAANALAVAYGDFREAYTIVDRVGIRILRDALTAKPFILFYTTKRVGGGVTNFQAIKIQKISA